jgi:hypothetical protein
MDQSRAPQVGQVVDHQFLWAAEQAAGQIEGRKPRPCVIIAVEARQDWRPHVTDQRNAPGAKPRAPCYLFPMTRTEAITMITAKLASLDDERVMTVADIVQDMAEPTLADTDAAVLELTDADLAAIARAKDDFKAGRTYTDQQYQAEMAAFMADLTSKNP